MFNSLRRLEQIGDSLQDKFQNLKDQILTAIFAAKKEKSQEIPPNCLLWDMVLLKILNIYVPEHFFNIYTLVALVPLAEELGLNSTMNLRDTSIVLMNAEILITLHQQEPFSSWDNVAIGTFIWIQYSGDRRRSYWLASYTYD